MASRWLRFKLISLGWLRIRICNDRLFNGNKMVSKRSWFVIITFFILLFRLSSSSTHWLVTEDGRVQAQVDSVFQLRRPYDLVAFLQQEERSSLVEKLKRELMVHKSDIDQNEDKEINLEHKLYTTDGACVEAGKPLTEFDLYMSTIILFESKGVHVDHLLIPFGGENEIFTADSRNIPSCKRLLTLDFSMHAFEHLNSIQHRWNLSVLPELNLIEVLTKHDDVHLFGEHVYNGLLRNRSSWILLNLAAYYWRMIGDANNAVECIRRALHFSPQEFKDIALINLANVLHRAQQSEEAAIVALSALDVAPTNAVVHFTLGNIYTVLADYNKSITFYEKALQLEPHFKMAKKHLFAVKCHSKLEKALEAQHNSLQKTLSDLRKYQERHELWLRHQEKLYSEQAPMEARLEARLEYEEQRLRKNLDSLTPAQVGNDCFHYERRGQRFLKCNVHVDASVRPVVDAATLMDLSMDIELMHTVETKAERVEEAVAKQKNLRLKMEVNNDYVKVNWSRPTKSALFLTPPNDFTPEITMSHCDGDVKLPTVKELPTVYLPVENKGFEVDKLLMQVDLQQYLGEQPKCPQVLDEDTTFKFVEPDNLLGEDIYLKDEIMKSYSLTLEEFGAKVAGAIKKNIGPKWLLYNLANIYWRAVGNVANAFRCLRSSIHTSPSDLVDVPLVNVASLLLKMAAIHDALTLIEDALGIAQYEPETNFLLANILYIRSNVSGAIYHYQMALAQKPDLQVALELLNRASCHLRGGREDTCSRDSNVCNLDNIVVEDDPLPDVISIPKERFRIPSPTIVECQNFKFVNFKTFTSTWLSVSAKGVDARDYILFSEPVAEDEKELPFCDPNYPATANTMDHLAGVRHRQYLSSYSSEIGLKEAFRSIGGDESEPLDIDVIATQISRALRKNSSSWVVSTLAALYWRIVGNASEAITCLRHSLDFSPRRFKDVPLISLANIFHSASLHNDALIVANMALDLSPKLVVIHFTLANIFAAKGQMSKAKLFYESTLSLQSSFDPARARLRSIQCTSLLSSEEFT